MLAGHIGFCVVLYFRKFILASNKLINFIVYFRVVRILKIIKTKSEVTPTQGTQLQ